MGIKAHFKGDINATFDAFLTEVERQVIESLCRVGEQAVTYSRNDHVNNWQDQTSNLRSSIGYVVFKDGKPVRQSEFAQVAPKITREGVELNGAQIGEALAKQVGAQTQGYTLVVVAGMKYAIYVESKGRDVLTTAEKQAEKNIARELADLVKNIEDAFK